MVVVTAAAGVRRRNEKKKSKNKTNKYRVNTAQQLLQQFFKALIIDMSSIVYAINSQKIELLTVSRNGKLNV